MRISAPLARELYNVYCELFSAVEDGIDNDCFFKLRECFRNIQGKYQQNVSSQELLQSYRSYAHDNHNNDGHLEVDDTAIVSVSEDGGAYVEAWIWVSNDDLPEGAYTENMDCAQEHMAPTRFSD